MGNNKPLLAHLCLFGSGAFWGLMAPVGKDAMTHGIEGIDMVSFRVLGGAILFWLTSLFTRREHIPTTDIIKLAGAGLFGLVFNQCCYTIGLSITSPSNSSIMTTSMPIFAMILSFLILREPITWKKVAGVLLGCSGAVLIIMTSATAGNAKVGNLGRLTLHGCTIVVCALSVALQALGGKVFALHHQQVDVHLGIGHDSAFLRLSCGFHPMG